MIVQRFLAWVRRAPAGARAEATSALARAYLYSDLEDRDRAEAETALTIMLDDPSPMVRRALAEALASAREAPHHCVRALAQDQSDIAAIVLARSPLLSDAELVECAEIGDVFARSAIAIRPAVSARVAGALVEVGDREALVALAANASAGLTEAMLRRMLDRFGEDGEVREAILSRPGLPAGLRADLVAATARALASFVVARDWMPEGRAKSMERDASEAGVVVIGAGEGSFASDDRLDLVRRLRRAGMLTPSLVLRALLAGAQDFFICVMAELSGLPLARVAGLVRRPGAAGFDALYARAGMPATLAPAFRIAVGVGLAPLGPDEIPGRPSLARISALRRACEQARGDVATPELMSLLRRLEADAVRAAARRTAARTTAANQPAIRKIEIDLAALEAELLAA